jgi:DNA-directed RNA polymerase beta subunit
MPALLSTILTVKRAAPPELEIEPEHRAFGDVGAMRDSIFGGITEAVSRAYPVENQRYRLELGDVRYSDDRPFTLKDQKKAIMRGTSLSRRLMGTWNLYNKEDGKLIDSKKTTVAHVPYITDRGTFIYKGNEYTVANQMRLRPGIYSRVKDNGIIEAHVNVRPGTGPSFRVYMEPETGVMRMAVGQSTLKMYPILKSMGAADRDIEKYWGRDILQANIAAEDPRAVSRAFSKLVGTRSATEDAEVQKEEVKKAVAPVLTLVEAMDLTDDLTKVAADAHVPTVAIDMDGTIALPYTKFDPDKIPNPRPGAKRVIKKFQQNGWRIIIWTVRGNTKLVRDYCHKHDIPYDYVNENPDQPKDGSKKIIADLYIDDKGIDGAQSWARIGEQAEREMKAAEELPGGLADKQKDSKYDAKELARGIEVEFEHTNDRDKAKEIAKDHLEEIPDYYTRLDKMEAEAEKETKEAKIGARESDMRWRKLWFRGTIRAETGSDNEPWVYVDVHKGLVDAALDSLKSEGINVDRSPNDAHITVIRTKELQPTVKKHKSQWRGACKDGTPVRFALRRIVHLIPDGWYDVDRVWFIEVESPDLIKYRKDLGLPPLPKADDGTDNRFHISFAVTRRKKEVKRAEYLFGCKRAEAAVGADFPKPRLGEQGQGLLDTFGKMGLDPEVTMATLGEGYENVSIPTLLRTSQKLLNISKKKEDIDDRDSLAYQILHGPEDFFSERIDKDAGQAGRKLLWRSTLRGSVQHVPSGALSGQLAGVLLRSGMGMPLEETNPMDIFDQNLRVLRLGEGGIPSLDSVPDEARNVQPSHFGYIDPIRAPESSKIGVDSRVNYGTVKGKDGQFYTRMKDARTGKTKLVSAKNAAQSVVAFPGELESPRKRVRAMVNSRQVEYVDRDKVDYELPNANRMFTASSNLVPMTSAIEGGRLLMGAKYVTQSLPLRDNEAPLVQNLAEPGISFDEMYGTRVGAVRARGRGVVRSIDKNGITVVYDDGEKDTHELYHNFPFNRKTFVHNTPVVKVGDTVGPNQLLAKSNYTDDDGTLAIGTNLRTAYMPYKGLNYEDAVVVSESAAKKLSSEHMYQNTLEGDENRQISRKSFVSLYPTKFTRAQLETIGDNGVVKPGTTVKMGDPLVLSVDRAKQTAVHKGHKPMFRDSAVTWDHEADGVVTDVDTMEDGGVNVTVRAYMPLKEGDKLAGRYGDKGVVAKVVPDDQMVHDADGNPYEILLNPQGIISRGNPAQIHETLLGKVARKRGRPYKLPSFTQENYIDYVEKELGKHKLHAEDDLYDPSDGGAKIPKVLTGERFIYKLHHTAESKGRGRDVGAYTSEGIPAKGGELGAKRVSNMEQNALISHGATEVLRDAQVVRGQRNDDYWRAFRLGYAPPSPKVPFVYDKFLGFLTGAGINVKKEGNSVNLFALTDKDIGKMSSGAITSPRTVEHDDLKEIQGGLFDRSLTGGHGGNRWSHIDLAEPTPNPVMEEPIRRMLGLTKAKFEEVIKGERAIDGKVGGAGIRQALKKINIESSIEHYSDIVKNGPKSKRDNAVKVLGYLKTMQKNNMRPEDWVLTKAPVLPPHFRPITQFRDMPLVADPNYLYQDMLRSNVDLKDMRGVVGERQMGRERLRLYQAFKAVAGLGDPVQAKTQEKQAKGLLRHVFGSSPKFGLFQRRVLGSPVDVVGRATITPNPDLSMDQVGLPEPKAWTIYRPFIVRRLIRNGMPAMQAATEVANQSDRAKKAMLDEMQSRPVIINRAPTLHRYGFMASWPVLTKGETLQVSPSIVEGFNADFDGDAMNYHVPVTDEAVNDAIDRMLPSKNLKAVRDFKVHYLPRQEFLMGLYLASTAKNDKKPRVFASKEDVIKAHQRGEISIADPVIIRG